MLDRKFRNLDAYCYCEYYCCANCPKLGTCKDVCSAQAEAQKKLKEEDKLRKAVEKEREAEREEKLRKERDQEFIKGCVDWARFDKAARAAGVSPKELIAFLHHDKAEYVDDEELTEYRERVEGTYQRPKNGWDSGSLYESPLYILEDYDELIAVAELLKCSVDYLLGRTDEKEPWAKTPWISCEDRDPEEGSFVFACTRDGVVVPSVYFRASFMDFTEHSVGNNRIQRVQYWLPLPAMPEGKKWQGQETLESILGRAAK